MIYDSKNILNTHFTDFHLKEITLFENVNIIKGIGYADESGLYILNNISDGFKPTDFIKAQEEVKLKTSIIYLYSYQIVNRNNTMYQNNYLFEVMSNDMFIIY